MMDNLQKLLDKVTDEETFINFIASLAANYADEVEKERSNSSSPYGPGANGWENGTINGFLEAAVAWGKASLNGLEFYEKPNNPWKRCAQILFAGKFYE